MLLGFPSDYCSERHIQSALGEFVRVFLVEHLVNLRLILIHKYDLNNSNSTTNHTVIAQLLQIVFNSAATKCAKNANRIAYEQ